MIEIGALLKDGRSALAGLQGSSPTGGFVTSGSRVCTRVVPGDLTRHNGTWAVAARTCRDAILGLSAITLIGVDGPVRKPLLVYSGLSLEVRTDTRIDPGTLRELAPGWPPNTQFPSPAAAGPPATAAGPPARGDVTPVVHAGGPGTLAALQETSPSGGRAASEYRDCTAITPGDLVRVNDTWAVTAGTDNDPINGVCGLVLIGPGATVSYPGFATGATLPVRTDTRIDPWTLYKLIPGRPKNGTARSPGNTEGTARPQAGRPAVSDGPVRARPGPARSARQQVPRRPRRR